MKGLKQITLVAAIAAASSMAQAEMISLDDDTLAATTGQAGLTVDINALDISVAAIDYKDQGFLSFQDVHFGGGADGVFDNIRMTIDIVGDGTDLGASRLGEDFISGAAALVGGEVSGNYVDQGVADGDLVIAFRTVDLTNIFGSVDFGLQIGSIGLGESTQEAGSVAVGTELFANIDLQGYLGPVDIIIDGQDEGMNISAYFNASGVLDRPFKAVKTDFYIHNSRGADTVWLGTNTRETSMAHMQINISKRHDYLAVGQTALALDIQNFEADLDFENLTLGTFAGADGRGIGDLYFTDLQITAETLIYGH